MLKSINSYKASLGIGMLLSINRILYSEYSGDELKNKLIQTEDSDSKIMLDNIQNLVQNTEIYKKNQKYYNLNLSMKRKISKIIENKAKALTIYLILKYTLVSNEGLLLLLKSNRLEDRDLFPRLWRGFIHLVKTQENIINKEREFNVIDHIPDDKTLFKGLVIQENQKQEFDMIINNSILTEPSMKFNLDSDLIYHGDKIQPKIKIKGYISDNPDAMLFINSLTRQNFYFVPINEVLNINQDNRNNKQEIHLKFEA